MIYSLRNERKQLHKLNENTWLYHAIDNCQMPQSRNSYVNQNESEVWAFLRLKKEKQRKGSKHQRLQYAGLNSIACIEILQSIAAFILHPIALITSGRPRVPIVCVERIIVTETQVQHFLGLRGKITVRIDQVLYTPLCFSLCPGKYKIHYITERKKFLQRVKW